MPKKGLDTGNCEIMRFLRLTQNAVEPVTFSVPRKGEQFRSDLYPDTSVPRHGAQMVFDTARTFRGCRPDGTAPRRQTLGRAASRTPSCSLPLAQSEVDHVASIGSC